MSVKTKTRIGILSLCLLIMASIAITPSMANIAKSFPDVSNSWIQMIFSLTSLTSLLSALIVGKLTVTVSKKKLALIGVLLIGIGGLIPYLYHSNFNYLLVGAAIIGLGLGSISTLAPALIAENFEGNERDATFGQLAACVSLGAVLLTVIGGKLAENGWEQNYLAYLLAFPLLLIAALTLPKKPLLAVHNHADNGGEKPAIHLNAKVFVMGCIGFMFLMLFTAFPNNLALFMSAENIGDVGSASLASAVMLISGLVSGVLFGKIVRLTNTSTLIAAFLLLAIGTAVTATSHTIVIAVIGSFFSGFSLSVFMARAPAILSSVVAPPSIPMAIAVYSAFTAIAAFASPLIINNLSGLVQAETPKMALIVTSALSFVVVVLLFISRFEKGCMTKTEQDYSAEMVDKAA